MSSISRQQLFMSGVSKLVPAVTGFTALGHRFR
jgi:hypothetical protein